MSDDEQEERSRGMVRSRVIFGALCLVAALLWWWAGGEHPDAVGLGLGVMAVGSLLMALLRR